MYETLNSLPRTTQEQSKIWSLWPQAVPIKRRELRMGHWGSFNHTLVFCLSKSGQFSLSLQSSVLFLPAFLLVWAVVIKGGCETGNTQSHSGLSRTFPALFQNDLITNIPTLKWYPVLWPSCCSEILCLYPIYYLKNRSQIPGECPQKKQHNFQYLNSFTQYQTLAYVLLLCHCVHPRFVPTEIKLFAEFPLLSLQTHIFKHTLGPQNRLDSYQFTWV